MNKLFIELLINPKNVINNYNLIIDAIYLLNFEIMNITKNLDNSTILYINGYIDNKAITKFKKIKIGSLEFINFINNPKKFNKSVSELAETIYYLSYKLIKLYKYLKFIDRLPQTETTRVLSDLEKLNKWLDEVLNKLRFQAGGNITDDKVINIIDKINKIIEAIRQDNKNNYNELLNNLITISETLKDNKIPQVNKLKEPTQITKKTRLKQNDETLRIRLLSNLTRNINDLLTTIDKRTLRAKARRQEAEARRQREEAEARRQREEAEAEARRQEEKQQREAEARRQREEAEAEARRQEEKQQREAEARRQREEAEAEARRQREEAEAEARRQEEKQQRETEARKKAEEAEAEPEPVRREEEPVRREEEPARREEEQEGREGDQEGDIISREVNNIFNNDIIKDNIQRTIDSLKDSLNFDDKHKPIPVEFRFENYNNNNIILNVAYKFIKSSNYVNLPILVYYYIFNYISSKYTDFDRDYIKIIKDITIILLIIYKLLDKSIIINPPIYVNEEQRQKFLKDRAIEINLSKKRIEYFIANIMKQRETLPTKEQLAYINILNYPKTSVDFKNQLERVYGYKIKLNEIKNKYPNTLNINSWGEISNNEKKLFKNVVFKNNIEETIKQNLVRFSYNSGVCSGIKVYYNDVDGTFNKYILTANHCETTKFNKPINIDDTLMRDNMTLIKYGDGTLAERPYYDLDLIKIDEKYQNFIDENIEKNLNILKNPENIENNQILLGWGSRNGFMKFNYNKDFTYDRAYESYINLQFSQNNTKFKVSDDMKENIEKFLNRYVKLYSFINSEPNKPVPGDSGGPVFLVDITKPEEIKFVLVGLIIERAGAVETEETKQPKQLINIAAFRDIHGEEFREIRNDIEKLIDNKGVYLNYNNDYGELLPITNKYYKKYLKYKAKYIQLKKNM